MKSILIAEYDGDRMMNPKIYSVRYVQPDNHGVNFIPTKHRNIQKVVCNEYVFVLAVNMSKETLSAICRALWDPRYIFNIASLIPDSQLFLRERSWLAHSMKYKGGCR